MDLPKKRCLVLQQTMVLEKLLQLSVASGWVMAFTGYSGFLNHLEQSWFNFHIAEKDYKYT